MDQFDFFVHTGRHVKDKGASMFFFIYMVTQFSAIQLVG